MSSTVSDFGLSKHVIARELRSGITADLGILCLITVVGLTVTALVFSFGFGPDLTEALGISG
jgi:hypothetical protein